VTYTIPPNNRAPLSTGYITDQNNTANVLTGMGAVYNVLNAAYSGGADPAGTAACDTAVAAAVAAVPAAGGIVGFPPGTYKYTSGVTVTQPGVYLTALIPGSVIFNYTGSGDCVRMYSTTLTTPNGVYGGGVTGGIIIDGTSASAGASGIHAGDIFRMRFDCTVRDFQGAGSKGFWFDNNYHWTEQITGQIFAEQCTSHVVFDNSANTSGVATGSFARTLLDIMLDCKGAGDGVILQGGAVLYDHRLGIYGNMDYSPSAQRWALTITGSNGGQFSRMQAGVLNIGMEINATSGTQPGTIKFGTAGSNYLRACTGIIDFGAASAFAGASNWDGSFQFDGPILGDVNLKRSAGSATSHFSAGAITNGGFLTTRFDSIIQAFPSGNVTGIILGTGDPGLSGTGWADQTVTVVNTGSGSITFAALATSHVATGVSCVIPAGQAMTFIWVANSSTWYPVV
jgi:hypothetical protein